MADDQEEAEHIRRLWAAAEAIYREARIGTANYWAEINQIDKNRWYDMAVAGHCAYYAFPSNYSPSPSPLRPPALPEGPYVRKSELDEANQAIIGLRVALTKLQHEFLNTQQRFNIVYERLDVAEKQAAHLDERAYNHLRKSILDEAKRRWLKYATKTAEKTEKPKAKPLKAAKVKRCAPKESAHA